MQDKFGFMWFGTKSGLNRYDGKSIKVYRTVWQDTTTLYINNITSLAEDNDGNLWVAAGGLQRYDRENDNFIRIPFDSTGIHGTLSGALFLEYDSSGILWIASWDGLQKFDVKNKIFTPINLGRDGIPPWGMRLDKQGNIWISSIYNGQYVRVDKTDLSHRTYTFKSHFKGKSNEWMTNVDQPSGIFIDERNTVWAYAYSGVSGFGCIFKFDWQNNSFKNVLDTSVGFAVNTMVKDSAGRMWAGTYTKGLLLVQENSKRIDSVVNSANPNSLSGMTILCSYVDRIGNVWFGTERGVSMMPRWAKPFVYYSPSNENSKYFTIGEVNAIREDSVENLWFTRHIPNIIDRLDRATGTFKHYTVPATARQLFVDIDGVLLVSSFPSPFKYDPQNDRFYKLQFHPNTWKGHYWDSFPPDDFLRESDGTKWFGYQNKFARVNKSGNNVRWYSTEDGLANLHIQWIFKDRKGTIWINPSDEGLAYYDRSRDRFVSTKEPRFHAHMVFEDSDGNFWIGSESRLKLYDRKADSIIRLFSRTDGLGPTDQGMTSVEVLGILEDNHKNIWLQTDAGIAKLNIRTFAARYYGSSDGIPAPSRNRYHVVGTGAHIKTKRNEMVFGLGASGFVMFYPDDIKDNPNMPRIVLTDFKLFNEPVKIGKDSPLKKNVLLSDSIELAYDQNEFTFEFAALDYTAPSENHYSYKLEGYDKEWVKSGNRNVAYYTNITPGEYLFQVKGSNNDGLWNEQGASVLVIISHPWWKTTWAYFGYFFIVATILFSARRYEMNRQQLKHQAELKSVEAEKLKEVDHVKTKFFANISHEFRTPLTLIEGPALQIYSGDTNMDPKENAGIIMRNAQRLLRLVCCLT
ncbi:MAG: hypothetical protein HYV29_05160 [Ignavibacteriales bacterium]|nr:hypothetical protein [Ignavibacteriales bacterium]